DAAVALVKAVDVDRIRRFGDHHPVGGGSGGQHFQIAAYSGERRVCESIVGRRWVPVLVATVAMACLERGCAARCSRRLVPRSAAVLAAVARRPDGGNAGGGS